MKRILTIVICLLTVISVFTLLVSCKESDTSSMVTEGREELKSVTIQLCNDTGDAEKDIIITDAAYMDLIFDQLSSTKAVVKKSSPQTEETLRLLLTYSFAYDGNSGEQDVVFCDDENNFYRFDDKGCVFGRNSELNSYLYDLFKDVELEMIGEKQNSPQRITIREFEGNQIKASVYLEDAESIDRIVSDLKAVKTKAILYPSELSAFTLDTEYEISLECENLESTVIFTGTETEDTFYRYTQTFGSDGEEGYILGKNRDLYEYLKTLCTDQKNTLTDGELWETGSNYEVFNTGSTGKKEYHYRVFNYLNATIDSGCTDDKEPYFYAEGKYLRLSLNYGTGAEKYKYYDVSKGIASEVYDTILSNRFTEDAVLIAYLTREDYTVTVAVRDAFDKKALLRTFKGEHPIKFSPSTQVEFISDEQLKITYLTGEDNDQKTEVFTFG